MIIMRVERMYERVIILSSCLSLSLLPAKLKMSWRVQIAVGRNWRVVDSWRVDLVLQIEMKSD